MNKPRSLFFLLLTALLPLSASAEMLLTSSWTVNWLSVDTTANFEIGQAYMVTVSYDETTIPVYSETLGSWVFTDSPMTMTLSIPGAGVELTTTGYASLRGGDPLQLGFYSDIFSDEAGNEFFLALIFNDIENTSLLDDLLLPTEVSQLPTIATMSLYLLDSVLSYDLNWSIGSVTEDPSYEEYYFFYEESGPYVGYEDDPFEGRTLPVYGDIDPSTATLTLEQVPEPSAWAALGGVLALAVGVVVRRRR